MFIFPFPISSAAAAKVAEFRGIPEIPETFLKVFISSLPVISAAAAKIAEFRGISEIPETCYICNFRVTGGCGVLAPQE